MLAAVVVHNHDILVVGVLSLVGVLVTATITWSRLRFNRQATRELAENIIDEVKTMLDTGNGHSAGQALARLEDQLAYNADRIDKLDVLAVEMHERQSSYHEEMVGLESTAVEQRLAAQPLREWVQGQMQNPNWREEHAAEGRAMREEIVGKIRERDAQYKPLIEFVVDLMGQQGKKEE